MNDSIFLSAINSLTNEQQPRVWSLIVSVFGDLASHQGDTISGPVLNEILAPVGIRPEAMRVAMHRLRNDGWIETTKRGREALHFLSAEGLSQSAIASRRIYASARAAAPKWHILYYPPSAASAQQDRASAIETSGYITIGPGIYLANGLAKDRGDDAMVLQGELYNAPKWMCQTIVPHDLSLAFEDLSKTLAGLGLSGDMAQNMTGFQIATLRALIVHRWRKLILKTPNVPDTLLGPDFIGITCRAQVMQALQHLPKPNLVSRP